MQILFAWLFFWGGRGGVKCINNLICQAWTFVVRGYERAVNQTSRRGAKNVLSADAIGKQWRLPDANLEFLPHRVN